jgi:hypothetical protein
MLSLPEQISGLPNLDELGFFGFSLSTFYV